MKNNTFAVLGLGKYGMGVADELMARGAEVLVVDKNERLIEQNAFRYTQAVTADLADVDQIRELGLGNMDAVIVTMAQDLEASIMSVMVAKESGVHRIIVKAENERKGEILKKVGASQIVFPEKESGRRTAFRIMTQDIMQFFDLTSNLVFVEMAPHKDWVGKPIGDLRLRSKYGINVIAVRKGDAVQEVTGPDTVIRKDEPMLIVMTREKLEKFENENR